MAEDTEKNGPEEQGKKKKRSRFQAKFKVFFVLIIILVVVFLLSGMIFVAFRVGFVDRLLNRMVTDASSKTNIEGPAFTYEIPEILVNLSEGDRRRFLSVKFYVGYDNSKLTEELERRIPEIRDAVLKILWETTRGCLLQRGKENLREEIKETVNSLVTSGEITGVYFWHVMIQ